MINKYAKGGKSAANQEQLVKLFQAAAENAQVDPQQLVQKASEIGQDEQAAAQFMQGLQLCAQGDPEGIKFIKSLFQSPAFRQGGKIWDFVCKHAKGGYVAGCNCGKNINKAQMGQKIIPWTANGYGNFSALHGLNPAEYEKQAIMMRQRPMYAQMGATLRPGFSYLGEYSTQDKLNPQVHQVYAHGYRVNDKDYMAPTKQGGFLMGLDPDYVYGDNGEKEMSRNHFNSLKDFYERSLPESNQIQTLNKDEEKLAGMENGGKVEKAEPGSSGIGWLSRLYNRYVGRRVPNTLEANNRRRRYWVDKNGVEHIVEDANVNGNSTLTNITINGDDITGTQKITTGDGRYRMINLQPGTPSWRTAISRNVSKENK